MEICNLLGIAESSDLQGPPGRGRLSPTGVTLRKIDYIHNRRGSRNWYVRLQGPNGRKERSLHTTDRRKAEVIAGPLITAHKAALLRMRPHVETEWTLQYQPGLHEGGRIYATPTEIHHLDETPVRIERNGFLSHEVVGARQSAKAEFEMFDAAHDERPVLVKKDADDELILTYLRHSGVTGADARNTISMWELFRELCPDTPLKDATRNDGRSLVERLAQHGLKSASISRKLKGLAAAVKLAIDENKLKFNPFVSIVPNGEDSERRLPLDDADMKALRANIGKLGKSDALLLRLLACTGMRLGEAMAIVNEQTERGVRYVTIGTKTEQSLRRVPLPDGFPAFTRRLFKGKANTVSNRLNKFLRASGIVDPRKVLHSLRHRMKDRLRAVGCPLDVQYELLGHQTKTVAAGYGVGSPLPLLKKWIDRAGRF